MNELAGYVTDVPYVYGFKPMLAPAWLDLVAIIGGVVPPARDGGFAWCDLGCGFGAFTMALAQSLAGSTIHARLRADLQRSPVKHACIYEPFDEIR